MAKPPRKKRINLDYECDAFGCRQKSQSPGKRSPQLGGKPKTPSRPLPRYETEVEKFGEPGSLTAPQTDVNLDVELIEGGKGTQLFTGSYQDAQKPGALNLAGLESKTFTPKGFPVFTEESRKALLRGGADPRTISPTAKPGELTTISKIPLTKAQEQTMKFRLGPDYDIAKGKKVASQTRYRIDPKTGERTPVSMKSYDENTISETNLLTGRTKIVDLSSGKVKYTKGPDVKVEKRKTVKVPSIGESIVESEEEMSAPSKEQIKAAAEAAKKPGYFSVQARKVRQRNRRRTRYAAGSGGGRT